MDFGKLLAWNAGKLIPEVAFKGYKKATKYLSPSLIVKATRRDKVDKRVRQMRIQVK